MFLLKLFFTWIVVSTSMFHKAWASFEQDVLDEHNRLRKIHSTPELKLDDSMNAECQSYAAELAAKDIIQHSKGPYGENLCYTTAAALTCVQNWYDEIKKYDYKNPGWSPATGHFTQVVWKSSTTLGVGQAVGKHRKNFVVCRYKPPGNVEGGYEENVLASSPRLKSYNYFSLFMWHFCIFIIPGINLKLIIHLFQ